MKRIKLYSIICLCMIFTALQPSTAVAQQNMTAKEIVQTATDKLNGESSRGKMKMEIVRPDWTREISMKVWRQYSSYYVSNTILRTPFTIFATNLQ